MNSTVTSISTAPQLFDRPRLMANRARAAARFDSHNVLFEETAAQLAQRLEGVNRRFTRILDIGARSFSLARTLLKQDANRFIVHCPAAMTDKKLLNGHTCLADEEWLPFRGAAFDLVLSNLHLHWANDLPGALVQMRRTLKPDGFFLACLFGGETLRELRECLYEAEMNVRGGASPHISPFADVQDCGRLMQRAGFALPVIDKERFTLTYRDAFHLMHELRYMGEGNVLFGRDRRFMPRAVFAEADALYKNRYADGLGQITATFDILFLAGWAPHDNQQRPLKPGEAQQRLAEALGTTEIAGPEIAQPSSAS